MTRTMNAIEITGLRKTYRASGNAPPKEALKGIDLTIPAGSIFGLLGPNGAGKSTTINILAGLVNKSAGQVVIWGFDQDVNPRNSRAAIGVMPQELNIDPFLSPRASLEVQAGLYGVPKAERWTDELLELVGLKGSENAYPHELSGGMRQRVAIARALVSDPRVLLMDEPFGALDEITRDRLNEELLRVWRELGMTVLFVTHSIYEAAFLGQRVLMLAANPGRVQEIVPTDLPADRGLDIRETPRFVQLTAHLRQVLETC